MARFLAVCLFAASLPLFAQLDRGTITGTAYDPSGGMIPAVQITVRNTATNATYQTESSASGQYTVPNLPSGPYQVTFESRGFKKFVRSNLTLGVTQVLRVDATLEVGAVAESIEVTAELPRLQTDSPEVGTALTAKSLLDLPLSFSGARLPESFAYKIAPTVYGTSWTSYISGGTAFSKETVLDGATVATNRGGHFGESSVSVEALQEFKIQTNGISAEFGRVQNGVFNYVMKSGANEIHGSGYGALRNEFFNANTFSNKAFGRVRPLDRKFDYAGSFGGPVYIPKLYDGRNKSFFYATYEHYWETTLGFDTPNITVPIPDFYEGDFSRLLGAPTGYNDALGRTVYRGAIYDPLTFRQLPDGQWVGDMFAGNRIPVSRFSSVSRTVNDIAKKHYLPTVRGADGLIPLQNNAVFPISGAPMFDQYNFSVKGDQNIGNSHKISGSYSFTNRPRFQSSSGYGRLWDTNDPEGGPLAGSRYQTLKSNLFRLAYDWTLTPRLLNHVIVYGNRTSNHYGNFNTQHGSVDGAAVLGIKGLKQKGYPGINWGGGPFVTQTGAGDPVDELEAFLSYGVLDTISFSSGKHFMKAGFDHRRYHVNFRAYPAAYFNFASRATAIPNQAYSGNLTGYAFASYLLGIVDNASLSDPVGGGGRRPYYGAFFQDDFKVSRTLTLNLGLRWDFNDPIYEVANRLSSWSPTIPDPVSGLAGAYAFAGDCSICTGRRYFGVRDFTNFGPRIGFAWQGWKGFVIRGAYGIMYEGDNFNGQRSTPTGKSTQTAWGGTYLLAADPVQPWKGIFNWADGFPQDRYQPPGFDRSWGNRSGPAMIDDDYGRSPYIQNFNLNVQRQLPGKVILDVGYAGNKGTRLRHSQIDRLNQLPTSVLSDYGTRLNNPVRNPQEAAANGIKYPFPGFAGTVASALRQYPQIVGNNTISVFGAPLGFSTFHSLQITANRQFGNGLTIYANYVWAKALANVVTSEGGGNPGPIDYYNMKLEKAVSANDIPHALKAYVNYELPFGRGKTWLSSSKLANVIAGGWSISGILNYFSGTPLAFGGSFPLSGGWNGALNRANIAAGDMKNSSFDKDAFNLRAVNSSSNTYLNKGLFSDPRPLTLGTAAPRYTQTRGFGTINEDLSVQKSFRLAEKYRVQFRLDMFDVFNRHNLTSIDTSITSPSFGQVTGVGGNRTVQINMRLDF